MYLYQHWGLKNRECFFEVEIIEPVQKLNRGIKQSINSVSMVNKNSKEIAEHVDNIAGISEITSAGAEEVAAASQEQTASIGEFVTMADELNSVAAELEQLIKEFNF